ncbi:MAG: DivIVA domain-containing protein [Candidatus Eremiobacteraeota bacterium]|nr:DivIVA domain-containing protein [Candidatus Eremiobacteraeota bacterium]
MQKITPVDIQHKTFKKALQGYDRAEVDQFLDDVIETLEDDAQALAVAQAEIADLRERISHFKSMEESLQNTLLLAQRTADEVKASAHKEADLIRQEAKMSAEREVASHGDAAADARREHQRALEAAEKAKSELRSLLMTHMSLLEMGGATPAKSSNSNNSDKHETHKETETVEAVKPERILVQSDLISPQPERINVY